MLPKQNRLPRSISFSNAKSFNTLFFKVLYKENTLSNNRFGFVISKKIEKRASARNRLKRILRASVESRLESSKGIDMLFIVRQSFLKEKSKDIRSLVEAYLFKII